MEKYYIPTIEEFHVGFEYIYGNLIKVVLSLNEPSFSEEYLKQGLIKVKYLDKEDFKSLGATIIEEEIKPYGEYFKAKLDKIDVWYAHLNNKVPYIVLTTKHFGGNTRAHIKNKSELVKLLEQIKENV